MVYSSGQFNYFYALLVLEVPQRFVVKIGWC